MVREGLFPNADNQFSEGERSFLAAYDRLSGLSVKEKHSASPPTRISELLNYKILAKLISKLPPLRTEAS